MLLLTCMIGLSIVLVPVFIVIHGIITGDRKHDDIDGA